MAEKMDTALAKADEAPPSFFVFPPEVRDKIYRLLLLKDEDWARTPNIQPTHIDDDSSHCGISTEILRTCRKIYDEAIPILYGENTWELQVSNYFDDFEHDYDIVNPLAVPLAIDREIGYNMECEGVPGGRATLLPHIRRFHVKIYNNFPLEPDWGDGNLLCDIRKGIQNAESEVLARFPKVDFLSLEFLFRLHPGYLEGMSVNKDSIDMDSEWGDWKKWKRQRLGDRFLGKEDEEECKFTSVVQTWLGRLRNVRTVMIKGEGEGIIPSFFIDTMKRRLESSTRPALTDMYLELEEHVRASGVSLCQYKLSKARRRVERDDFKGFKKQRQIIKHKLKKRLRSAKHKVDKNLRKLEKELYLYDPDEDSEEDYIL